MGPSLFEEEHLTIETIYQELSSLVSSQFFSFCQSSFTQCPSFLFWKSFWLIFLLLPVLGGPFQVCSCRSIQALVQWYLVTHLIAPVFCDSASISSENYLRGIALYCLQFKSTVKFSPTTDFLFCNQIILERYLMSDNPLTHVNLKLKSDIYFFPECPFHHY